MLNCKSKRKKKHINKIFEFAGPQIKSLTLACCLILTGLTTSPQTASANDVDHFKPISQDMTARSQDTSTLDKVTLQLKWKHHFQFAGYYAAAEQGYYREAGLDVQIIEGRPGLNFADEVVSGRANYGIELPGLLIDRAKGKPIVALAAIFQHSPLILISLKERGLSTPQDLLGHTVSISRPSDAELLAMFINEGVSLENIKLSDLSWNLDDLLSGKLDAIHAYLTNEPHILSKKGIPHSIIRPKNYGIDFYGDTLFTSERELKNHPARVEAFTRASLRGWQYAMDHPEEVIDVIMTRYGSQYSRDDMLYEAKITRELMLPDLVQIGHMNPGRWKHIGDTFAKLGLIEPDYSLDGFVYTPRSAVDNTDIVLALKVLAGAFFIIGTLALTLYIFNRRLHAAVNSRTRELSRVNRSMKAEIAERKSAERQLVEARDEATKASLVKSEFLASVSHELRTPLNAILGFAEILGSSEKRPMDDNQKIQLEYIVSGGTHLLGLVNQVLDLARIESGDIKTNQEPVDINALVNECITLTAQLSIARKIRVINKIDQTSSNIITTDLMHFKQALINLLSNAIKYNVDGGIVIIDSYLTDKNTFRIEVKDNGIGIATDDQRHVFKMFHRIGTNKLSTTEGSGIGLNVTKSLIEK